MMKPENAGALTCPKCRRDYTRKPSLSRDNRTLICPECGIREALDALGVDTDGQEAILAHIRRYEGVCSE